MPRYQFEARGAGGAVVRGVEFAPDELSLDRMLADSDLLLIRATHKPAREGRGSSTRALIDFCYHLAIVSESGIPLIQGLRDLSEGDHPMQTVIADVARRVESGETLSASLAEHPAEFPELMVGLVRAGEESGTLDRVLHDLAKHLEWREDLARQIRVASMYPALVVVGICGLGFVLGAFVLPQFLKIFDELGATLPPTTRALVFLHAFFRDYWWLAFGGLAGLGFGGWLALKNPVIRHRFDQTVLRLPLLGKLALMIDMSRFAHNLGTLLASGMPILRALAMVEDVVSNRAIRDALARGRDRVEQGATLTDALGRSDILPPLVMRMLSVGEVSGRLDESLERVASYYDREVPAIVERAIAVFNMVALLALGAALVTIALSIFAPLYQAMGELSEV
ncbi:MAG: type II secretion system F family protein [Myxococcota bacterium]